MRFYSGFSFKLKWRYIKWLAIPFFAILSYFSGAFGFIKTYAYQNYDTYYNVKIDEDYITDLQNQYCDNLDLLEYFDYIISSVDWSSSYFQAFSGLPQYSSSLGWYIDLVFYPTQNIPNDILQYRGTNMGSTLGWPSVSNFQMSPYESTTTSHLRFLLQRGSNNRTCFLNSNDYDNFKEWPSTLNYIYYIQNGSQLNYNNTINDFSQLHTGEQSHGDTYYVASNTTINNYDSYNNSFWFWWSSMHYKTNPNDMTNNTWWYYKKIHLVNENITYNQGDYVDGYYTLHRPTPIPTFSPSYIGSKNSLGTIYTNFEPSYINHFDLDISFNTNINYISGYDYYQNIDFTNFNCYGRINHNDNYYSYEKFSSCTFELNTDNLIVSSDNDFVEFSIENLEIYDSNDIKITNFSSYDKIFIYLDFQYDDDTLNTYVSNLEFNSPMNMLYLDSLKGEIFDDFDLPSYFKMFISNTGFSNSMASNLSVRSRNSLLSSNNFLYSQPYSTITLEPTQVYGFISTNFQNLAVNNSQNMGYMIYHQINNLNENFIPHLDMVLMRDIIVSFRNVSSNDFYYADDTGTIVNNNIEVDYSYGVEESFGDITGLLPPGPLDSLLNIPFKYLSKTINSLGETCSPLSIPFVFDSELTFPCFDTYYEEFPSSLKLFTEVVPCAFILIFYFKHLYKKISRATTLETTDNDEWGCL